MTIRHILLTYKEYTIEKEINKGIINYNVLIKLNKSTTSYISFYTIEVCLNYFFQYIKKHDKLIEKIFTDHIKKQEKRK